MGFRNKAERVLAAATSAGGLSELVTFHPAEGDPYPVRGIWDDDHTEQIVDIDAPISTTGPMVSFRASDLQAAPVAEEDQVEFDGALFVITDVQPDGQGTLDCILNRIDPEDE
jgi:hypothetical protein